jgi:hypothetical protein
VRRIVLPILASILALGLAAGAAQAGFFRINTNDGQVDSLWSDKPMWSDPQNDSGDGGAGYDLLTGWAAPDSLEPSFYSFRVTLAAPANVDDTVVSARFDCNLNGDFGDAIDVYVDYDMTIDRVNVISGDLLKDYFADTAFGEQIGDDIEWSAPTRTDPNTPSIWAACSPATASVMFEALDSNYHLKDNTSGRQITAPTAIKLESFEATSQTATRQLALFVGLGLFLIAFWLGISQRKKVNQT